MAGLRMTVEGRELLFRFDVLAWQQVEERFGSITRMKKLLDDDTCPMMVLRKLAAITASAGERYKTRKMDAETVTEAWLTEHLSPMQMRQANSLAEAAVNIGQMRENADDEDDQHEVDEVLEEIEKKRKAGS